MEYCLHPAHNLIDDDFTFFRSFEFLPTESLWERLSSTNPSPARCDVKTSPITQINPNSYTILCFLEKRHSSSSRGRIWDDDGMRAEMAQRQQAKVKASPPRVSEAVRTFF